MRSPVVVPSSSTAARPVVAGNFTMRPQNQRATIQNARTQHKTNSDDVSASKASFLYRVLVTRHPPATFSFCTDVCGVCD